MIARSFFPLAAAGLFSLGTAWCGVVYSNLGTGSNLYDPSVFYGVTSSSYPSFSFTPANTVTMTGLDIPLARISADSATVSLMNDANGVPGSTTLQSWNLAGLPYPGSSSALQNLSVSGSLTLFAGTPYWVMVSTPAVSVGWNLNNTGAVGTLVWEDQVGNGHVDGIQTMGAFRVWGDEVAAPEPGTGAYVLGAGLLALMARQATRRKA
jgi:hypothetical protein